MTPSAQEDVGLDAMRVLNEIAAGYESWPYGDEGGRECPMLGVAEARELLRRLAAAEKDAGRYRWLRDEDVNSNPIYYPFWEEFMTKLMRDDRMDVLIDKWMDGVPEPEPENDLLRDDGPLGVGA